MGNLIATELTEKIQFVGLGPSLCESVKYFYTPKSKNITNDVITYFKLVIIKTIKFGFLTFCS